MVGSVADVQEAPLLQYYIGITGNTVQIGARGTGWESTSETYVRNVHAIKTNISMINRLCVLLKYVHRSKTMIL